MTKSSLLKFDQQSSEKMIGNDSRNYVHDEIRFRNKKTGNKRKDRKDHIFVIRKQKNAKSLKKVVCKYPKCRLLFDSKVEYRAHKSVHSDSQFYKCYIEGCRHSYKKSVSLKKHLAEHNKHLQDFYCTFCKLTFNKYTSLKLHLMKSHKQSYVEQMPEKIANRFTFTSAVKNISRHTSCSSLLNNSHQFDRNSNITNISNLDIINAGLELIGMKGFENYDTNHILAELLAFKESMNLEKQL